MNRTPVPTLLFVAFVIAVTCPRASAQSTPAQLLGATGQAAPAGPGRVAPLQTTPPVIAPSATVADDRLFFMPTAEMLPAGTTRVGVYQMSLVAGQVGVTDRFSVGAGTVPVALAMGGGFMGIVTPKLQVLRAGRTRAAIGAYQVFAPGGSGGLAYGVVTRHVDDGAVNVGGGVAYGSDGWPHRSCSSAASTVCRRNSRW